MRIGIVLHGPEIIDVGCAKRIIEIFKQEHEIIAKLGGTMGRTAVLDAGIEDTIDISQGLTPSETINALKDSIDLAILLNHGKTLETGRYFGRIIASKIASPGSRPLIHIERPGCGGRIIYYSPQARIYAEYIRTILRKHYRAYDLPIELSCPLRPDVRIEGDKTIRRLSGVFPDENIRLEGIVIGYATRHEPEIVCKDGRVIELRGGKIKLHGLEKLESKRIDLFTAKVKTGSIRRTQHRPKIKNMRSGISGEIVLIDHCAESTFELIDGAGLVISVGDDTTAIAADILARLGIPLIGITDGDLDYVLSDTAVPVKSVIIRVRAGFDDIIGKEIFEKLMRGKQRISMYTSEDLLARILTLAEKYVLEIKYY